MISMRNFSRRTRKGLGSRLYSVILCGLAFGHRAGHRAISPTCSSRRATSGHCNRLLTSYVTDRTSTTPTSVQSIYLSPRWQSSVGLADYLNASLTGIDLMHQQVALLREYRTRLIADVVTGKLDVREAAARLPDEPEEPEPEGEAPLDDADGNGDKGEFSEDEEIV